MKRGATGGGGAGGRQWREKGGAPEKVETKTKTEISHH